MKRDFALGFAAGVSVTLLGQVVFLRLFRDQIREALLEGLVGKDARFVIEDKKIIFE